jgi:hypothetical protein
MLSSYGETYWYWNTPPPQFQRFVCNCNEYKPGFNHKLELPSCRVCNKLPVHFIRKCDSCEELFLKDFHAPSFCTLNPKCWNCLDTTAPMCDHIPWGLVSCVDGRGIVPPQLIKKIDVSNFDPLADWHST